MLTIKINKQATSFKSAMTLAFGTEAADAAEKAGLPNRGHGSLNEAWWGLAIALRAKGYAVDGPQW